METKLQATSWLNRNVLGAGLTSFLADTGYETVTSIFPSFLAGLGAPPYALGIIEGVADSLASFVKLGAGWWSDRVGHRKAIVTLGYALTGLASGLFALAGGWYLVLFGRTLAWFGKGIRGPLRNAILASSVAPSDRGKVFGFHRAGDTLGAVLGPMVGALFLGWFASLAESDPIGPERAVLWLTVIPGLAAAGTFALMIRERRQPADPQLTFWSSVRLVPGSFRRYLVGVGIFGAGDFSHTLLIMAGIALLEPSLGPLRAAQTAAILYGFRNIVGAVVAYPLGALGDRLGRPAVLLTGYLLAAGVMVGFALVFFLSVISLPLLFVLFALAGVYIAIEEALENAITADLIPDERIRGTAFGILGTVNGIGDLISSAGIGIVWAVAGFGSGFIVAATLMVLGAAFLYRVC